MTAASRRDRYRAAANRGRIVAQAHGQRETTVTVRVETYSGPVGMAGTTLVSTTDTLLVPSPKVRRAGGVASYFGGGAAAGAGGPLEADEYEIGPITPPFPGGGYSLAQLLPAGGATSRISVILAGEHFGTGERFVPVEEPDPVHAQHNLFRVRRSHQRTSAPRSWVP
jgi:hypothetical protein